MTTETTATDRSAQALAWAKGHLANGIGPERLVEGLMKQGWPEYDARVVLDTALTTTAAPTSATTPPPIPGRTQVTANRAQQQTANYATPPRQSNADTSRHVRQMGIGALLLLVGLVITVGTFAAASTGRSGGTYLLCWGPIIFGGIRLVTGFFGWISSRHG
jgi:hypothetical protein